MKKFSLSLLCTLTALVTFCAHAEIAPVVITTITSAPISCSDASMGINTGSVTVTIAGGTSPYTVTLSSTGTVAPLPIAPITQLGSVGQTLFTFNNLPVSTNASNPTALFEVTVVDSSVMPLTDTAEVNVASFCPITVTSASFVDPTCNGAATGTITVNVSGGPSSTYFYSLNGAAPVQDGPSHTFSGLGAGDYTIAVAPTAANLAISACVSTVGVTLTQPGAVAIAQSGSTEPTCNGGSDGTLTFSVTGGVAPYAVTLTGTPTPITMTGPGPDFTFTGLAAGSYSASVTDANGCTAAAAGLVTQQTVLSLVIPLVTTPTSCPGGSDGTITATANNPTGLPLAFSLISPTVTQPVNVTGNTYTFTGLSAGNYQVKVQTQAGTSPVYCAIASAVVTSPAPIVITTKVTNQDIVNQVLGTVVATVTGGTLPYKSVTLNPGNQVITPTAGQTVFTFNNLVAGSYTITVVDANNCTQTQSVTVACVRGQSTNPITNFITNVLCKGQCELPS